MKAKEPLQKALILGCREHVEFLRNLPVFQTQVPVALLICLAVLVVGVPAYKLLTLARVSEPVYQGKRLTGWLEQLVQQTGASTFTIREDPAVYRAVREMGTNAIPTLLKMLRTRDPPFAKECYAICWKDGLLTKTLAALGYWSSSKNYALATRGFDYLGCAGTNTIRELLLIPDGRAREAIVLMGWCSWPVVTNFLNHTNRDLRLNSLATIREFDYKVEHEDFARILPAIFACLNERDSTLKLLALLTLHRVPSDLLARYKSQIEACTHDHDPSVARKAAELLRMNF